MINLNQFPDYKLMRKQIKSLSSDLKSPKKEQLVLHIGKTQEDFINFLKSNIFYPNNFNAYYTEKLLVSSNKKIRKMINQQNHYKEINEKSGRNLIYRNTLSAYKNLNLFYDLTDLCNINAESKKASHLIKMREFFDIIYNKYNSFSGYKEKIIVWNIDNMSAEDKESYLFYFLYAIKRKEEYFLQYFQDCTFMFYSVKANAYFKFVINEDIFKMKQKINLKMDILTNNNEEEIAKEIVDEVSDEKVNNTTFSNKLSEKEIVEEKKETKKKEIKEKLKDVGVDGNNEDIEKEIDKAATLATKDEKLEDLTEEELMNIMLNKEEFKQSLIVSQQEKLDGHRKQNAEQLKIQQDKIKFKDVNLKDLKTNYEEKKINTKKISDGNIKEVLNEEILTSTLKSYDDTYMEKKFNKDIAKVLKAFNDDEDIGVYIKDIKLTDNNTDMSKQSCLEVDFKDDTNVVHKFKVNIPEIKDGKFMFINGTKKVIMKQIVFLPIVKLEPDRVQITTNYNKHFVMRFGQRFSEKLDYLKKLFTKHNLASYKKPGCTFEFKFGNSTKNNGKFISSSEYNDISSYIYELKVEDYVLVFDQLLLNDMIDPTKPRYDEKISLLATYDKKTFFPVGYLNNKKKLIISNIVDKQVYLYDGKNLENLNTSLSSWIITLIYNNTNEKVKGLTSSKAKTNTKLTYSRIEINNKKVPLVILLSYELGLLNLMERYNIEYNFDTRSRSVELQDDIGKIKFKDGYLYFDTSKIRNTILLSGLLKMDCEEINFSDMNTQEPYLDFFQEAFNSRNAAKGFHNTLTLLIDPITKEILEELNQPTNVYDVLLYANTLLEDISFTEPSDVNNFRIRGAEQIPAMLYKVYADAFKHYKDSKHAKNPIKITVDPDILTKKLMELKTIESYSSLNPSLELERMGTASMKGLAGINVNEAYTKRVRAFNSNMVDLVALNTPEGNQVGIVKQLTYDPKISNIYGFIDPDKKGNGSTSQYDVSELLNVSTTNHADSPRISMQSVQQKHIISIKEQDPPLIGSGIEKTVPYMISDEFAFKAKEDGVVESIDYKNKVAILKYKSGKQDLIDLDIVETNNSNGGFYVSQRFELLYHTGEKFTKGAVVAKNPLFFSGDGKNEDIKYTLGHLTKVAIASADFTLEDSSIITEKLSDSMATKVTMRKVMVLDKNATVSYIAKEGQPIKTNEPLMVFENAFNDDSINSVLGKIGTEFAADISEISKNELKCKYTGNVVKINIYYTNDISEYSESIQKIINSYIKEKKSRKNVMEKIKGTGFDSLNSPIIEKQTDNKIRGEEINDGIMFEFFIEYYDDLSIGDKIIYGTALKTIVSNVMGKGEEPYSEFRTDENVDAVLSPLSINSRMTLDVFIDGYTSKALIELKRKIKEIYESN